MNAVKKADLNLLVIFDAIMREGSIARAAEQLAMTQPAVSNAVARMRIAWNDPVFVAGDEALFLDSFAAANHLRYRSAATPPASSTSCLLAQGLDRRVAMTVNHFSLVAAMLRESNLISTVPYDVVAEAACKGGLRVMRPPVDMPPVDVSLLWHERSDRDAGHRWLRDQLQAIAQETRQDLPLPACVFPAPPPQGDAA